MPSLLEGYLADWLAWVENGAPQFEPYSRGYGLCSNTDYYSEAESGNALIDALGAAFDEDDLDRDYPFGRKAYDNASDNDTMHLDEDRLAWVRSKLL